MTIYYITNGRIPNPRAYGIHIVKMCEALASKGAKVTLVAQKRKNMVGPDLFEYYSVPKVFDVLYLPIFDAVELDWRGGFWINQISFSFRLFFTSIFGDKREYVVIARDEVSAFVLSLRGCRVFYDMHGFPVRSFWFWRLMLRRVDGIIVTNTWKKKQCEEVFGISPRKIIILPNGFDERFFENETGGTVSLQELGIPKGAPSVLYTGHLYDWKGVYVLAEAASLLPEVYFVFVGGTPWDVASFRERYQKDKNIIVLGHKPYASVPSYLRVASILVLPNSQFSKSLRHEVFSRYDTSPIKLFEYMASGKPIIASDLPSIREIVSEKDVFFVKPDSPEELASCIRRLLVDSGFAERIAKQAKEDSKRYTWEKRAEKMLEFVKIKIKDKK